MTTCLPDVVGGYNREECLRTVECYDPKEDRWTFIAPMRTPRARFQMAVLMVQYGFLRTSRFTQCVMFPSGHLMLKFAFTFLTHRVSFTLLEGQMVILTSWAVERRTIHMLMSGLKCQSCGPTAATQVSQRLPRESVADILPASMEWLCFVFFSVEGVCSLNNKLYVVGGSDPCGQKGLKNCDAFDPVTKTWSKCASLNISMCLQFIIYETFIQMSLL